MRYGCDGRRSVCRALMKLFNESDWPFDRDSKHKSVAFLSMATVNTENR